jgi:hypothetical protein
MVAFSIAWSYARLRRCLGAWFCCMAGFMVWLHGLIAWLGCMGVCLVAGMITWLHGCFLACPLARLLALMLAWLGCIV